MNPKRTHHEVRVRIVAMNREARHPHPAPLRVATLSRRTGEGPGVRGGSWEAATVLEPRVRTMNRPDRDRSPVAAPGTRLNHCPPGRRAVRPRGGSWDGVGSIGIRPSASWVFWVLLGLGLGLGPGLGGVGGPGVPDAGAAEANSPYRRLREATLGYHGPSEELPNPAELRFGWFGPTNLDDPLNGDVWWAVEEAAREANSRTSGPEPRPGPADPTAPSSAACPVNLPVRLIPCWAADPWGSGVSRLGRMVYDEAPLALLGSVDSASTHLAEQITAKANLPLVSPISTDSSVTLAGVSWMFTCAPSDAVIARALVADVLAPPSGSRGNSRVSIALLAATDHESRMTAREVVRELSRCGHPPDSRFDLTSGTTDLAPQLAAWELARPETVVVIAGPDDSARWLRAIRAAPLGRSGNGPRLYGGPTLGRTRFRQLAGTAAEGVRFPLLLVPGPGQSAMQKFGEKFAQARGHEPDYAAVLGYDATRLLIEAARRTGPNRARVREELARLSPWAGLAGPIVFDGTGQNLRSNVVMGTIRDGAVVPLATPLSISADYR